MSDPIILEENKTYKVKPPMMSQSALYQLSRYAYENDLRFGQILKNIIGNDSLFFMENRELEKRIKAYINENNSSKKLGSESEV